MAYLAKQQAIKQWAGLVIDGEVTNLKQIQQVEFTSRLLLSLDPDYFKDHLSTHSDGLTFSQLFSEISHYYAKQIGTNIHQIMGEDANIYSTSSIEQIWQLILGIAIKGRNRQNNINTILKMRTQTQQQLMRIISQLINRLGENVSVIDNTANQVVYQSNVVASQDADIIIQLSQQNEQLKQKLQQLNAQINHLKEINKNLKLEMQDRSREKRQIANLILKQSIGSKISISSSSGSDIVDFIKDLMGQVHSLSKQLNKKQQKQQYYQEVNKDLKMAYSTILMQLQNAKSSAKDNTVDVMQYQKQIQALRSENLEHIQRQKDLISKIGDLEEQKFYLKGIVQRFEAKNNISEQKIQKIITTNKVSPSIINESNQEESYKSIIQKKQSMDSFIYPGQQYKVNVLNTVKKQMDQSKNPSLKNKLQREVSHLQRKLNTLQEQNNSLKKINSILQKVINDFTKQNQQIIQKYESSIQPIFKQFLDAVGIAESEKAARLNLQQQSNAKDVKNQQKMHEIMAKIKQKIQQYDNRQIQYQKIIKKLQIQRIQLLAAIKNLEQIPKQPTVVIQKPKIKKQFQTAKISLQIQPTKPVQKQQQQMIKVEKQQKQEKIQQKQIKNQEIKQSEEKSQKSYPPQKYQVMVNSATLSVQNTNKDNKNIAASIIVEDQEQEPQSRRREYSFMANRQSSYNFGGDGELGFQQKNAKLLKISSLQSKFQPSSFQKSQIINEQHDNTYPDVGSLGHVEIIDITQIQEQLMKIKQHYVNISNQSERICQQIIKSKDNKNKQNKSNIESVIKNYQNFIEKNQQQTKKLQLQQFLKNMENTGIDKVKLITQNHKIKQQNSALKKHLIALNKQRQNVQQRLVFLHQQSSKNHDQKTKQQFIRLSNAINEIRVIMIQSQSIYSTLQNQINQKLGKGDKQIGALNSQIEHLKLELKQRQYAINQLEMESNFLLGAVLQFRNNAIRIH